LNSENIQRKIDCLLIELQDQTGVSSKELDDFKKILDLADFSEEYL
tara:strand:+ start:2205 stop:2342 length:138 start_codon:yes stop_codon:yes gene_type:complete